MHLRILLVFILTFAAQSFAKQKPAGEELFSGPVPVLKIEIPAEGMETLRAYHQVWRQERPQRIDVKATVREGEQVYKDVAVHLKGAFSFQGIDEKPSLTLNFDKFAPKRLFHGLSKIHLNNSVQDPTGLCEQLARGLFMDAGIVAPRATPARVFLNGRDLGICVMVEGANKSFVKRSFESGKGNLYDGGSGMMDIDKDLPLLAGKEPAERLDLKALREAAVVEDPAERLKQLEKVLDVDQFITFVAIEALLVHWDGYAFHSNNYRMFHDAKSGKFMFMPHGMDQLFGTSSSPEMSLTQAFKGTAAKALFGVPEAREKYLKRIEELARSSFKTEALHARVDKLAERYRGALSEDLRGGFDYSVEALKGRIERRGQSIIKQIGEPPKPLEFADDGTAKLAGWRFRSDPSSMAQGNRVLFQGHELLRLRGTAGDGAGATWRTAVLLDEGSYEFFGLARTRGDLDPRRTASGVMLRISGEKGTEGMGISADEWKEFRYSFVVRGVETVELVCEFRGPPGGVGEFDASSLKLIRKQK